MFWFGGVSWCYAALTLRGWGGFYVLLRIAKVGAALLVVAFLVGCEMPTAEEEKITIVGRWVPDDVVGSLIFYDDGTFVLRGEESRVDGTWQYRDDTLTLTVPGAPESAELIVTHLTARRLCIEVGNSEGCFTRDE